MDPAFWTALPSIIAACLSGVATIIGAVGVILIKRGNKKIDDNTKVTVESGQQLYEKVDSATKEVTEQATVNTKVAANAVIQTALVAEQAAIRTVQHNKEIAQSVGKIEERLNGGPHGLTTLTNRVASLEGMYAEVVKGQVDIVKSIEHIASVVDRKLGVKEV